MGVAIRDLPDALERWHEIRTALAGRSLTLFLDFDGTLSPIVDDPSAATLTPSARSAIEALRVQGQVVVMSGRDADDVRARVGIADIVYAGSHGFDVVWPDGRREQRGVEYQPSLERAAEELVEVVAAVPGAEVEPKRFAVTVHHRRVEASRLTSLERDVAQVAERFDDLRLTGGKRVLELRPTLDWHKGRAVAWLLEELPVAGSVPIYVGDDLTDEDAFAVLARRDAALAVVVRGEDDQRTTLAHYAVADVEAASVLLGRLAGQHEAG